MSRCHGRSCWACWPIGTGCSPGRDAEVAELRAQVAALEQRLARVERLVSRNSGNSSFPPSMDDQPGRPPPQKPGRQAGRRKPGKQPGAPGHHLAWREDPDETVPHFPAGACECGAALADGEDLGVTASCQQVEIPLASAQVIQHDLYAVACRCGRVRRAAAPAGAAAGTVSYGPNLQAWCVFLMVAHAVPVHRCAELIESLTGAKPSPGFVHGMIARAAAAVAMANKAIRALIILAHVVCADETPIRVGPGPKSRKRYLLVACTGLLTYYFLCYRSLETFAAFLLPDLADAAETYPDAHWPVQITQAPQGLIRAANTARRQGLPAIPAEVAGPLIHAYEHGVILGLGQLPKVAGRKQSPCRALLQCLRDRQDDVLRFATDLRIPPTSNQAERDVRPAKTQEKISGRLRSEQATRHRYAIRGYISTAAKHGENVLTVVRDAITGNPWMPPIPDPP